MLVTKIGEKTKRKILQYVKKTMPLQVRFEEAFEKFSS
jgi:hypothetical protein